MFKTHPHKSVLYWLIITAILIIAMVMVGGFTRLTGSGLSITQWKPILGAIPPMNIQAWLAEFTLYQKIPQFHHVNSMMTLDEFKSIYWWEWGHRQLGRFLGLVFTIPLIYFWIKEKIPDGYKSVFVMILIGGAFQGFLGWFMVKSGLTERISVSQYRLALHLGFAVLLYGFILQVILSIKNYKSFGFSINILSKIMIFLVFTQIISGAFMAGTHSGYIYNTWPLLDGHIIPSGLLQNGLISLFEDTLNVQFVHRSLAYCVFFYGLFYLFVHKNYHSTSENIIFICGLCLPVMLGILTLITVAPIHHIELAVCHQISAILLFTITIIYGYRHNLKLFL